MLQDDHRKPLPQSMIYNKGHAIVQDYQVLWPKCCISMYCKVAAQCRH